jgi:two-component system, NtrC family, sensor histidine kinase PilS
LVNAINTHQEETIDFSENEMITLVRLFFGGVFFLVFQSIIVMHKPFMHIDFLSPFYMIMSVQFTTKLFYFYRNVKQTAATYIFDISLIYILFNQHPQYSSAYLIYITLNLFLSSLHLPEKTSWNLFFLASLFLSMINLKSIQQVGAQNFLTLALFNLTYASAIFIGTRFKSEVSGLKTSLLTSSLKLKTQLDLSRILMEQVPVGVIAMNSQAEVIFKNNTLLDKMNVTNEFAAEILQSKDVFHLQKKSFYNSRLNERRYYETDHATYHDQELNDRIELHLIKDITEQVVLQDQLRQKEKLAAVGQLAAGIAHEIRNPLAGISGSIQLLSQDKSDPDEQKLMKIILKEIDRLNNLITEFLDYSKPDQIPDQIVDLSVVLEEVINNIQLGSKEYSEIKIESELIKSIVYGFSDKLKQAFLNICVNALQAMNQKEDARLVIKIESAQNKIVISIKDNGIGMSDTVKQRIFEPFYTTKSKGTGLGMAITHKILEAHKADIQIISEQGQGTEFRIFFTKVS